MLINIFGTVLLPLVLIATLAFMLGRFGRVNPQPLALASFYLFNPALAFVSLATTDVAPDLLGRLVVLKLVVLVLLVAVARWLAARLRLPGATSSAFVLTVAFANSGNYGLSVNEYAFGKAGLALAVICYVADNLTVNSVGVYFGARGRAGIREALLQVFRNPALYALVLGLATHELGWQVPLALWRGLESLSRAAVPTMLAVLGMQLAALPLERRHWRLIGLASLLRLVAAPALASLLVKPLGLSGLARQVGIVQCAPPTAVMASIVASRYDVEPAYVSGAVLVSSILSLITMTVLLSWVM